MPDTFKIVEMKRVSDQWEIKASVPSNMFGFASITMKVEAEVSPEGGGLVERDIAEVMKTFNRRIAYDLQRLADIAFGKLDKESIDMVRRVLVDEAAHGSSQTDRVQ